MIVRLTSPFGEADHRLPLMSFERKSSSSSSHKKTKRRRTAAAAGVSRAEVKHLIATSAERKYQTLSSGAPAAFSFGVPLSAGVWPLVPPGTGTGTRVGNQIVTDWLDVRMELLAITGVPCRVRYIGLWDTETGNTGAPATANNFFVGTPNWLSPMDPNVCGDSKNKNARFRIKWDDVVPLQTTQLEASGTAGGSSFPLVIKHKIKFGKNGAVSNFVPGGSGIYADIIKGSLIILLLTEQVAGAGAPLYQFVMNGQFRDAYM